MILKNGDHVNDTRLGCIIQKAPPRTGFKMATLFEGMPKLKPVSRGWQTVKALDQGNEGCCVSMGIAHELLTPSVVIDPKIDVQWCKERIYWPAQDIDPWAGSAREGADPFYEGTTLEAGLIVTKRLGCIKGYRWADTIEDVLVGWSHYRPPVFALHWKEGMMEPDNMGTIHYRGQSAGGHCLCGSSIEVPRWRFSKTWCWLQQSWGPSHGIGGLVRISASDLEMALNDYGQAAFLDGRRAFAS